MVNLKKLILTVIVGSVTALCSAQIPKGTILAGASSNLGFSNYKPDGGVSTTNFNLNAKGGYFIIDNLAVGVNFGIERQDQTNSTLSAGNFGVFGRYYIMGKIFAGAGIGVVNTRSDVGTVTNKTNYTQINLHGVYALFLNPNIAVEPALNININAGVSQGVGVGLAVGFTLFLNRK